MLQRLLRIVVAIEDGLLVGVLSAMIILAGVQIVLRTLFDTGLVWAEPALRMAVLWLGLLGAMVATRGDRHIRVDVLPRWLPPGPRRAVQTLTELFAAGVCGLLAYSSARLVRLDLEYGAAGVGPIDAWVLEAIMPIAFGIMALRFLVSAVQRARGRSPLGRA
jgi:TRAP-type C4-dicarboxylate transport system permease small subunit